MNLFGLPYYHGHINENEYDKKSIVETIEENYYIDSKRNAWKNYSNMHHAYDDWENSKFKKVNFDSLIPIYEKEIKNFLSRLKFKKNEFEFQFVIVNYTCMKNSQFMGNHDHHVSDFSAVHYLKFNPFVHESTLFHNHSDYAQYFDFINNNIESKLDANHVTNSWICKNFKIDTIEDDIIIFPGILKHQVPPSDDCDELRMTVVFNINLK